MRVARHRTGGQDVRAVAGRRVLVDGALRPATVHIEAGRITAVTSYDAGMAAGADVLLVPDTACVLPGVVDTHVHVNEPGRTEWEGFATATRAAALGGVTTLVDMPLNSVPATTSVAALRAKQEVACDQVSVDVGFWGGAVPESLGRLEELWEAGVFGFKCFLAPSGVEEFPALDEAGLRAALAEVAAFDGLLIVHAEDADVLDAAPHPPSRAYADFLLSRPPEAETAAIDRLLDGAAATGARVHVLHLSSARALDRLAAARGDGVRVSVETCPHYLCFAAEQIPDAAPAFKCCPPIRDEGNRDALWDGLTSGVIGMVVSDHSPATAQMKCAGDGDLQQAWGGISGLQVSFAAVAQEAGRRGIGIEQVSAWMSRSTADLIGLDTKGRIEVGADADLLVHDTAAPLTVAAEHLAHRNPISAYDGMALSASVTHTLVRGRVVAGLPNGPHPSDEPVPPAGRLLERTR
ncbi:allantoinase AllB [Nocardioides sp. zg-ZUI104]|uniref:allantoinase AllB n=1 Tax=Nocardioides faecalis TaxID=2803858 RepID=UPI001BCF40C8|nr:allantoinase AllB [Nocardioides faecalis]MBS4753653.1 allantoinase AllB [Nocardioides faecalis]